MNRLVAVLLCTSACVTEEPAIYRLDCDFTDTSLAWDDATELGGTSSELVTPFEGERTAAVTWAHSGTPSTATITVARDGSQQPVQNELVGGGDAAQCGSSLQIPLTVQFATDDGAFAESFAAEWVLGLDDADVSVLSFGATIANEDLAGTFEPAGLDPDTEWPVGVRFGVAFDGDGVVHGEIVQTVNGEDDESAWDRDEPVATF